MIDNKGSVPYLSHERDMARMQRMNKRLFILCMVLLVLLTVCVTYIIVREQQFQQVTIEQEVEQNADNGVNHFIGGDNYGDAAG